MGILSQERKERLADKYGSTIIVLGGIYNFLATTLVVVLAVVLINFTTNAHQSSIAKSNQIIASQNDHDKTLNEIKTLEMQVKGVIDKIPPASTAIDKGQAALLAALADIEAKLATIEAQTAS